MDGVSAKPVPGSHTVAATSGTARGKQASSASPLPGRTDESNGRAAARARLVAAPGRPHNKSCLHCLFPPACGCIVQVVKRCDARDPGHTAGLMSHVSRDSAGTRGNGRRRRRHRRLTEHHRTRARGLPTCEVARRRQTGAVTATDLFDEPADRSRRGSSAFARCGTNGGHDSEGVDKTRLPRSVKLRALVGFVSSIIAGVIGWYSLALFGECDSNDSYGWVKLMGRRLPSRTGYRRDVENSHPEFEVDATAGVDACHWHPSLCS